jgi:hypothetical protein
VSIRAVGVRAWEFRSGGNFRTSGSLRAPNHVNSSGLFRTRSAHQFPSAWTSCLSLMFFGLIVNHAQAQKTIAFVGVQYDQTDFSNTGLNIGQAGYWFPQFNAASPVSNRPTNENDRNALPSWAPINFTTDPADPTRTFSLDNGGVKSEGGDPTWNPLKLPNGEMGLSGSVVDPQTVNNSNNTINKIVLTPGVAGDPLPQSFLLHIVVDNTNHEHDPVNRIRPRGEGPTTSDTSVTLTPGSAAFNGIADVYTFRYTNWVANDFIKLQLSGAAPPATGAGFAGLMFDVVPEPSTCTLLVVGLFGLGSMSRRRD